MSSDLQHIHNAQVTLDSVIGCFLPMPQCHCTTEAQALLFFTGNVAFSFGHFMTCHCHHDHLYLSTLIMSSDHQHSHNAQVTVTLDSLNRLQPSNRLQPRTSVKQFQIKTRASDHTFHSFDSSKSFGLEQGTQNLFVQMHQESMMAAMAANDFFHTIRFSFNCCQ